MNPRLANATSPYLRAHQDNPVDWYPWTDEALALARRQQRPILLSIGYSACHWCHVMARESFSDPEIAAIMNRHFVNIKIDREERPDLDRVYQTAHAMLTQRPGGWPLTVVLNPEDLTPFYAGTYFPPAARFGLPGFGDLLMRIAELYAEQPDQARRQGALLQEALDQRLQATEQTALPEGRLIDQALLRLMQEADLRHGGLGSTPKFPQASVLQLLDRHADRHPQPDVVRDQVDRTLAGMASGGLFDHVGGGFYRYCVDADWTIPHFEKMLYDNAQLLGLYGQAAGGTGAEGLRAVVDATIEWLLAEMQLPQGGMASSLDADTQGAEGATYLWTPDQIRAALPEAQAEEVLRHYGLDRAANFEGYWHLAQTERAQSPAELNLMAAATRRALYRQRAERAQPKRDDKCLTGWNALAATGLFQAGLALEQLDWVEQAQTLLDQLLGPEEQSETALADHLAQLPTSRLEGEPGPPAFLDDFAYLLEAQWWGLQARPTAAGVARVRAIINHIQQAFGDPEGRGGFYLSTASHQSPMGRSKPFADDATPAGNAVLADMLLRLGYLLGEPDWLEQAEGILRAAQPTLARMPEAHCRLLLALSQHDDPDPYVVIRSPRPEDWEAVTNVLRRRAIAVFIATDPRFLPDKSLDADGDARAYVCRGTTCLPPLRDPSELARAFD